MTNIYKVYGTSTNCPRPTRLLTTPSEASARTICRAWLWGRKARVFVVIEGGKSNG